MYQRILRQYPADRGIYRTFTCVLRTCNGVIHASMVHCLLQTVDCAHAVEIADETGRVALEMDMYVGEATDDARVGATHSHEWVRRVVALLDTAACQLDAQQAAHSTILKAASLLRTRIDSELAQEMPARRGGLSNRCAREVCAYIESHIAERILIADLCALVNLSASHFSRVFTCTFGERPHAFLIRRRVELAAQYMLQTEVPLSEIALRCGFADQPHLCKHFRQKIGNTPAAWRHAHGRAGNLHKHGPVVGMPLSGDMLQSL
jgi:AraC family transcriptional regulator